MAEGYMKAKYGDRFEVFSAGTEPTLVHPMAIAVMNEIGIDISRHRSKLIDEFFGNEIDTVVTVCDSARGVAHSSPAQRKKFTKVFRIRRDSLVPMRKFVPNFVK